MKWIWVVLLILCVWKRAEGLEEIKLPPGPNALQDGILPRSGSSSVQYENGFDVWKNWLYYINGRYTIRRLSLVAQHERQDVLWLGSLTEPDYIDGSGTVARFRQITDILIERNGDSEDVSMYIMDYGNGKLRKQNYTTRIVSTVGNFTDARTLSLVQKGQLWIAANHRIFLFNVLTSSILYQNSTTMEVLDITTVNQHLYMSSKECIYQLNTTSWEFSIWSQEEQYENLLGIENFGGDLYTSDYSDGKIWRISATTPHSNVSQFYTDPGSNLMELIIPPESNGALWVFLRSGFQRMWRILPITEYTCSGILRNETATVCSGHGSCIGQDLCLCSNNYEGSNCEQWKCSGKSHTDPLVCNQVGNCTAYNTCECPENDWTGSECQTPLCYGTTNCGGFGTCLGPQNCSCNTGHSGKDCSTYDCFGRPSNDTQVCGGHGSCQRFNHCSCDYRYLGSQCSTPLTCNGIVYSDSDVCNGQGNCTSSQLCDCSTGWTGNYCDLAICFGLTNNDERTSTSSGVCAGNGRCIGPDECLCNLWSGGVQCEASFHFILYVVLGFFACTMCFFGGLICGVAVWLCWLVCHRSIQRRRRPALHPSDESEELEEQTVMPKVTVEKSDTDLNIPIFNSSFLCPITQEIMQHPVVLVETGHNFEKDAICMWLYDHGTCPVTRAELKTKELVKNTTLKATIEDYMKTRDPNIEHEQGIRLYLEQRRGSSSNGGAPPSSRSVPPPVPLPPPPQYSATENHPNQLESNAWLSSLEPPAE